MTDYDPYFEKNIIDGDVPPKASMTSLGITGNEWLVETSHVVVT